MLSRALQVAIWTCLATAGVAFAAPVGGEPTLQFDRCDRFIAPCGDPVVVGKARFYDGRYEWVAMDVADGICFYTEVINRFSGSGSGGCGPKVRPPGGKPLGAGWHGPGSGPGAHGPKATHIGGPARLGVARIRLTVRKGGERRRYRGTIIRVDGDLLEKIGEQQPFAYWGRSIAGCVPSKRIRVRAYDSAGALLGAERPPQVPGCGAR